MHPMRRLGLAGTMVLLPLGTNGAGLQAQSADTLEDHHPVVSPDGRTLAFMSNRSGVWAVYLMPLDRSRPARRVSDDPRGEWYANWSPDSKALVYHRNDPQRGVSFLRLFHLSTGTEEALGPTDGRREFGQFSPDGRTIYYRCRGWPCRISPDGKEMGFAFGMDSTKRGPVPSPDGRWIAYVDLLPDNAQDIFVARPDGSERRRLTNDPGRSYGVDWSPDGRYLTYNTAEGDNGDIYVYDMVSRVTRQLTKDPANDHMPRWLPDGSGVVFTSERSGHERIYRIGADGTGLRMIDTRNGGK